jgi:hypothetical protein|tara:strand:+ start:2463 stop:2831 length:369 start_codon:yes stop_codon:yes gene_type:complete
MLNYCIFLLFFIISIGIIVFLLDWHKKKRNRKISLLAKKLFLTSPLDKRILKSSLICIQSSNDDEYCIDLLNYYINDLNFEYWDIETIGNISHIIYTNDDNVIKNYGLNLLKYYEKFLLEQI